MLFLFLVASVATTWGEENSGTDEIAGAELRGDPVPYEPSEFPEWAHKLRRAEVVAIGSLPLTIVGVRLLYGFARYAAHGFAPEVAPVSFGRSSGVQMLSGTERLGIVIGAAALSVVIALIDADMRKTVPETVQGL